MLLTQYLSRKYRLLATHFFLFHVWNFYSNRHTESYDLTSFIVSLCIIQCLPAYTFLSILFCRSGSYFLLFISYLFLTTTHTHTHTLFVCLPEENHSVPSFRMLQRQIYMKLYFKCYIYSNKSINCFYMKCIG